MYITPTVTKDNKIDIVINTELSRINQSVKSGNYHEITKRHASSSLQIKSGKTVVLAGLIETTKDKEIKWIPFLCDIPMYSFLSPQS